MTREEDAVRWLLRFKGPGGLCDRLEQAEARLRSGEVTSRRRSGDVGRISAGRTGDPVWQEAMAREGATARLMAEATELTGEVAGARLVLSRVPHGALLADYYLDPTGEVTWAALASELGVAERTCLRRRDEGVAALARMRGLW